jgi:hypothetical protein
MDVHPSGIAPDRRAGDGANSLERCAEMGCGRSVLAVDGFYGAKGNCRVTISGI